MPKLGTWLVVAACLLAAQPLAADTELTYAANSPEMVGPSGEVTGGRTIKQILLKEDGVRSGDVILRRDKGVIYWLRPQLKEFCRAKLPFDPQKELSAELYDNLYVKFPLDEGTPAVKVSPLEPRTIGRSRARWRVPTRPARSSCP